MYKIIAFIGAIFASTASFTSANAQGIPNSQLFCDASGSKGRDGKLYSQTLCIVRGYVAFPDTSELFACQYDANVHYVDGVYSTSKYSGECVLRARAFTSGGPFSIATSRMLPKAYIFGPKEIDDVQSYQRIGVIVADEKAHVVRGCITSQTGAGAPVNDRTGTLVSPGYYSRCDDLKITR